MADAEDLKSRQAQSTPSFMRLRENHDAPIRTDEHQYCQRLAIIFGAK